MNPITATIIIDTPALAEAINALAKAILFSKSNTSQNINPSIDFGAVVNTMHSTATPIATPVQVPPVPTQAPPTVPNNYNPPPQVPVSAPLYSPLQSVPNAATVFTPQQQAPTAPIQAAPSPVPTSAPEYTIEQIQLATAPLCDAGRLQELQAILKNFGLNSLLELPKERYPDFANALRLLGGKI